MKQADAIDRGFFRQVENGSTVFFPWGLSHRGYVLPDSESEVRARRVVSCFLASVVGIGVWAGHVLAERFEDASPTLPELSAALALPGGLLLMTVAVYAAWAMRFVERCAPSDLQLPRETRLREAAELAEPRKLGWAGLALVLLGAVLWWFKPNTGWVSLLAIAIGIAAVVGSVHLDRIAKASRTRSGGRP